MQRLLAPVCCLLGCLSSAAPAQESAPQGAEGRLLGVGRALELTLEGALEIALRNNLGLRIEALNADILRHNRRGSWSAFDWVLAARGGVSDREFQPSTFFGGTSEQTREFSLDLSKPLTTGATFKAHFDTVETETDSDFALEPRSTTDVVSLSLVQPLLRGAWSEYATSTQRIAEFDARAGQEQLRQARQKLLSDVSNAYWDLVAARAQLEVAESSLGLARAQTDQNQRRLDAGLGTPVELLQAQAEFARREEGRLLAEVRVRQAADGLRVLLFPGRDVALWDTALVPSTPLPQEARAEAAPAWAAALACALEYRPELRQQRLRIDAAAVRHGRSGNERWPSLDLDLTASSQGWDVSSADAFETAAGYDYPTYRAALVLNYPIGGGAARHAERAAWSALRAARLGYDQVETQIVAEVRESVRQVVYHAQAVAAARRSLDLAQRQLEAEQARYQQEVSTTFQVLEFQTKLIEALTSERAARASYAKALTELQRAQGLLGEQPGYG